MSSIAVHCHVSFMLTCHVYRGQEMSAKTCPLSCVLCVDVSCLQRTGDVPPLLSIVMCPLC